MVRVIELKATDTKDLGHQLGEVFREEIRRKVERAIDAQWPARVQGALRHWSPTKRYFPKYAEELLAYAHVAGIRWQDLWTLNLEIDIDAERCTTMVTNGGRLIGHNEDFDPKSTTDLFLLKKTVGRLTVLDLNYFYSLGGNAASVNSHGWAQFINTLHGPTLRIGVPRNVIARWLSETKDPETDVRRLRRLPRMDGYAHTFVHADRSALSVESSSAGITIGRAPLPFVHTNHYLSELADVQTFASGSSKRRYDVAKERLSSRMTIPGMKRLMADHSRGNKSIQSAATIGKMIVNFPHRQAEVWLKRDPKGAFTKVPLDFLP